MARDRHFGAAYGHGLFDDRVHFVIGGEYEKQDCAGLRYASAPGARRKAACIPSIQRRRQAAPGVTVYGQSNNLRNNQITFPGVFQQAQPGPFPPNPYANFTSVLQASPDGTGAVPYQLGAQPYSTAFLSTTLPTLTAGGQGVPLGQYDNLMAPVIAA